MTFQNAKDEYERQREREREKLAQYLDGHNEIKAAGLHVVTGRGTGKGIKDYPRDKRIPTFDLRNWKWVEIRSGDGFDCVISLNMPDIDPGTHNIHSLYDRIGLVLSPDPAGWVYTDIDLPLDEADKEQIAQLVLKHFRASLSHKNRASL